MRHKLIGLLEQSPVIPAVKDDAALTRAAGCESRVLFLLGGDLLVNTLDGQVKLKVKPGTQSGTKVRLKGKGFPVYKQEGVQGDLIVTYHVQLPTNLTEEQKDMFRKIQRMN